jgi:hypothetical protein
MSNEIIEANPTSSELSILSTYNFQELARRLKITTIKDNPIPDFYPYLRSEITLERIEIDKLFPCALYVLNENLDRVARLHRNFSQQGIDIFNLQPEKAILGFSFEGKHNCTISPPLVEKSKDDGNKLVITDGLHRVTKAKMDGNKFVTVTIVKNAAVPLPALPVGWDEVKVVDQVPPSDEKRRYRFQSKDEIYKWEQVNWQRFRQGFDVEIVDGMMELLIEENNRREEKTFPYAPWDFLG